MNLGSGEELKDFIASNPDGFVLIIRKSKSKSKLHKTTCLHLDKDSITRLTEYSNADHEGYAKSELPKIREEYGKEHECSTCKPLSDFNI